MDFPIAISGILAVAALTVWGLFLLLAWLIRRRLMAEFDRLGESSSEEMLDELENAYAVRQTIRIGTQTEYLPFVFESIRELAENGFDDKQMLSLLERIEYHRPHEVRQAVFPLSLIHI